MLLLGTNSKRLTAATVCTGTCVGRDTLHFCQASSVIGRAGFPLPHSLPRAFCQLTTQFTICTSSCQAYHKLVMSAPDRAPILSALLPRYFALPSIHRVLLQPCNFTLFPIRWHLHIKATRGNVLFVTCSNNTTIGRAHIALIFFFLQAGRQ